MQSVAESRTYTLQYTNGDFTLCVQDGITTISSNKLDLSFDNDTLTPALPSIGVNLLLGKNEEIENFSYQMSEMAQWTDIYMAKNESSMPVSLAGNSRLNPTLCSLSANSSVEYIGSFVSGCYHYASFLVRPFRYDAVQHTLQLMQSIDINLQLSQSLPNGNSPLPYAHSLKRDLIKKIVENKDDFDSLYALPSIPSYESLIENPYAIKYLIITNGTLQSAFQRLADWKTAKGVKAQILKISDIYSNYNDSTNQLKIKHAIRDIWLESGRSLKYVLLGGDENVIPVQKCYVYYKNTAKNIEYSDNVASDHYYACLDELDWDKNRNGRYAELQDDVDLLPDVVITRIPVYNVDEANVVINRILEYECYRNSSRWSKKMLLSGSQLYSADTTIVNGFDHLRSDAEIESENLYRNSILGNWDGAVFRLYDSWTDYPDGQNYVLSGSALELELEKGYTFLNMTTHGIANGWTLESGGYYWQRAINQYNSSYTLITTSACFTNKFDSNFNCLGEVLIKGTQSGVIGYIGSSAYGWTYTSNELNESFYRCLFQNSNHSYGGAFALLKAKNVYNCFNYSTRRWLQLSLNALGDPEQNVFIEQPLDFPENCFSYQNGTLTINTNTDSCRVCIMSMQDNGLTYYNVIESVNSNAVVPDLLGNYTACVTRPGYRPKRAKIYNTIAYIQNETFNDDVTVFADRVIVGSNVTNEVEHGPVVIQKGKTTISAIGGVTIEGETTIEKGAELEIY